MRESRDGSAGRPALVTLVVNIASWTSCQCLTLAFSSVSCCTASQSCLLSCTLQLKKKIVECRSAATACFQIFLLFAFQQIRTNDYNFLLIMSHDVSFFLSLSVSLCFSALLRCTIAAQLILHGPGGWVTSFLDLKLASTLSNVSLTLSQSESVSEMERRHEHCRKMLPVDSEGSAQSCSEEECWVLMSFAVCW